MKKIIKNSLYGQFGKYNEYRSSAGFMIHPYDPKLAKKITLAGITILQKLINKIRYGNTSILP